MALSILAFTVIAAIVIVLDGSRREQRNSQKRWAVWTKNTDHLAVVLAREQGYPC